MYFVKVSDQKGINLDHVSTWHDFPEPPDPLLILTMLSASENEYGQRQPHDIRLCGKERETMLHWLAQVGAHDDWKARYEESRREERWLSALVGAVHLVAADLVGPEHDGEFWRRVDLEMAREEVRVD